MVTNKDSERMSDDELQNIVHGIVSDAVRFIDDEVSPDRLKATQYYKGEMVKELQVEEGRSSVIMSEVRDNVHSIIPSFLRLLFGPSRVVEFTPNHAQTVEQAEQQSDYVEYVFKTDNPGFMETHSVVKDGLVRKLGIYKWGWDQEESAQSDLDNLSPEQFQGLLQEPKVSVLEVTQNEDGTFNARVETVEREGRCWVKALPPEEFIFSRDAKSVDEATFIGHKQDLTRSDLIKLGISEKDIDAYASHSADTNLERQERQPTVLDNIDVEAGKANEKFVYIEGYTALDVNGDGFAELVKLQILGDGYHVVGEPEQVRSIPFATYSPYPEPHTMLGQSQADMTMDMQRVKTNLVRNSLDSFSLSLYPRTAHQDGMVNINDLENNEVGANIRTYGPPEQVLKSFTHNFIGKDAFPFLEYMDGVVERRTGRSAGAAGLDIDALQSTEKDAARAAVQSTQEQTEMLVRIFCETTLKRVMSGIRDMLIQYQPRSRVVQLRGRWVEVDPRVWDANLGVKVNVALGAGLAEQKIAVLAATAEKMEKIFEFMGLDNPLVSLVEYRNTLAQMVELAGHPDSENYWKVITPEQLQAIAQAKAQQPPPPSPEQIIAQAQIEIEKMKAEKDIAIKEAELELKRQSEMLKDDRERDKNAADIILKKMEIEAKYAVQIEAERLNAEIQRERNSTQSSGA
jgi:hypothetical protein